MVPRPKSCGTIRVPTAGELHIPDSASDCLDAVSVAVSLSPDVALAGPGVEKTVHGKGRLAGLKEENGAGGQNGDLKGSMTSSSMSMCSQDFAGGESEKMDPARGSVSGSKLSFGPIEMVNENVETVKAALALLFVAAVMVSLGFGLPMLKGDFVEPDCQEAPADARSCEPCGKGTFLLPFMGEWERSWNRVLRVVLYFFALIWLFMGVGMVCDQFMIGIEEITASQRSVWVEVHSGARRRFLVQRWNATIANLSLMALGSSAPEVMLSATELIANRFYAGKLGPSTIVGSAAFNLLIITSVCIIAIPAPGKRTIENTEVFCATTIISILAYLWLLVILQLISPDRVEIWEGVVTLCMFPLLLVIAFAADKGLISAVFYKVFLPSGQEQLKIRTSEVDTRSLAIQARYGKELPPAALQMIVESEIAQERSAPLMTKAQLRKNFTALITGGSFYDSLSAAVFNDEARQSGSGTASKSHSVVFGFKEHTYIVLECAGDLAIKVVASRDPGQTVDILYKTEEGSAKKDLRYTHVEGTLTFGPRQREATIHVPIIDNDSWDPDEEFYVHLSEANKPENVRSTALNFRSSRGDLARTSESNAGGSTVVSTRTGGGGSTVSNVVPTRTGGGKLDVKFGTQTAVVTVLNDDMPGVLRFDATEVQTTEGATVTLSILRQEGMSGRIECEYMTQDGTATGGKDYEPVQGSLIFEDGQIEATIEIPILVCEDRAQEDEQRFWLSLSNASPGVKFDANCAGGETQAICDIIILPIHEAPMWRKMLKQLNSDRWRAGMQLWKEQYIEALYCCGSAEEQAEATLLDWFFHVLNLFWKLSFAIVPPPMFCGGWATFFAALAMIGIVTAFIGELASLLGCSIGMPDEVTAITLVALGTSLPDTFASMAAARQDDTADNAIGNIMGSNSVNVFLGLGISWTMGSIYWEIKGKTPAWLSQVSGGETYEELFVDSGRYPSGGFMVPAGTLAFSVCVYCFCACCCVGLLVYRRRTEGGELGGASARVSRMHAGFLAVLWAGYVVASSVYATDDT